MSQMLKEKYDVVIVGAGPAGSVTALYLLQAGIKPLILDREPFPRYHIGESLTGECGACLRELGLEEKMQAADYPIKRGVTVYGAEGHNSFNVPVKKRNADNQLIPAFTWQVRRNEFDHMLLSTAMERGADFICAEAISPIVEQDSIKGISLRTEDGQIKEILSEVLVDASGQTTFLANRSNLLGRKERSQYDKQVATFSQVKGAIRDPGPGSDDTIIFYRQKHHWAWFIPLDKDLVSIGVVAPGSYIQNSNLSKEEFLKRELQTLNPELSKRLTNLDFVEPVRSASNYSYHVEQYTGKGFLCVGDAHRFIDPIFSFGVYFGIKEAQFASQAIVEYLSSPKSMLENPFAAYQNLVEAGQNVIQDLINCFWEFPLAFLYVVHTQHPEDMIDIFAGRIYGPHIQQSKALRAIRSILN